jgi:hypothetical protein
MKPFGKFGDGMGTGFHTRVVSTGTLEPGPAAGNRV